jgi:hypothetical protein
MDYTTFHLPPGGEKVPETEVVTSLYETLQHLADARRSQRRYYELALLLCLLVLAKLARETRFGATTC